MFCITPFEEALYFKISTHLFHTNDSIHKEN